MKTFYEPDEKGRMRITESKGSKKPIKLAKGFVKKVEDMQNINDADYDKAIEEQRRLKKMMKNKKGKA